MHSSDCRLFVSAAQEAFYDQLTALIEESSEIAVCAHTNPDGDALGSTLAFVAMLQKKWPYKRVTGLIADSAPVPRIYRFLPGSEKLVQAAAYDGTPDLFVAVDLSLASRMNDGEAVLRRSRKSAVIDHHPCGEPFGDISFVRPDAAAVGVLIAEYALHMGIAFDVAMSEALLCAIITDTGRFQYQNTNAEALDVAALLVGAGASPSLVSLNVYQSFRLEFLHLEAAVMSRIVTFAHGKIAYSYATEADLERTGASLDEADGLIDVVRSVDGAEVALFLKEIPGGKVRGNLRSKSDLDVSSVAQQLGGGGHRAAAGFTVDADIDEALSRVLPKLRALFPQPIASAGSTTVLPRILLDEKNA